jgi:hypothetical protein
VSTAAPQDRGQPDRPGADDGHDIAGLDLAIEHTDLIARREDVSKVEHLLVGEPSGTW